MSYPWYQMIKLFFIRNSCRNKQWTIYILLEKSPNTLQKNANYSLTDYEKWSSQKNFYNRIVSNLLLIYYTSQLSF